MATVKVKFEDGSQQVFNNVPDNMSPDQFKDVIRKAYPNKKLVSIEKLKDAAPAAPANQEPYRVEIKGTPQWVDTGFGYLRNVDTDEFKLK